jgi:hypothetical protein
LFLTFSTACGFRAQPRCGWGPNAAKTQRSAFRATLGYGAKSLWDFLGGKKRKSGRSLRRPGPNAITTSQWLMLVAVGGIGVAWIVSWVAGRRSRSVQQIFAALCVQGVAAVLLSFPWTACPLACVCWDHSRGGRLADPDWVALRAGDNGTLAGRYGAPGCGQRSVHNPSRNTIARNQSENLFSDDHITGA